MGYEAKLDQCGNIVNFDATPVDVSAFGNLDLDETPVGVSADEIIAQKLIFTDEDFAIEEHDGRH
jgi:hypothetical protein